MKYEELQLLAEESELDIVAFTESWANSSLMNAELALDGFRMFRKDSERDVEQMVGGVRLLYINLEQYRCIFSVDMASMNFGMLHLRFLFVNKYIVLIGDSGEFCFYFFKIISIRLCHHDCLNLS